MSTKLKKQDTVQVVTGKDKGKKGRILRIDRVTNQAIVEGINIKKKTQKPKNQNDKGGIIEIESMINLSNLQIVCKKCGISRIGWKLNKDIKVRVCRKCRETL